MHRYWREDHVEYFRAVESILRGYGGRPHWGKIHFQDADGLSELCPKSHDVTQLRDRLDPDRLFANPYLDRVLGT